MPSLIVRLAPDYAARPAPCRRRAAEGMASIQAADARPPHRAGGLIIDRQRRASAGPRLATSAMPPGEHRPARSSGRPSSSSHPASTAISRRAAARRRAIEFSAAWPDSRGEAPSLPARKMRGQVSALFRLACSAICCRHGRLFSRRRLSGATGFIVARLLVIFNYAPLAIADIGDYHCARLPLPRSRRDMLSLALVFSRFLTFFTSPRDAYRRAVVRPFRPLRQPRPSPPHIACRQQRDASAAYSAALLEGARVPSPVLGASQRAS